MKLRLVASLFFSLIPALLPSAAAQNFLPIARDSFSNGPIASADELNVPSLLTDAPPPHTPHTPLLGDPKVPMYVGVGLADDKHIAALHTLTESFLHTLERAAGDSDSHVSEFLPDDIHTLHDDTHEFVWVADPHVTTYFFGRKSEIANRKEVKLSLAMKGTNFRAEVTHIVLARDTLLAASVRIHPTKKDGVLPPLPSEKLLHITFTLKAPHQAVESNNVLQAYQAGLKHLLAAGTLDPSLSLLPQVPVTPNTLPEPGRSDTADMSQSGEPVLWQDVAGDGSVVGVWKALPINIGNETIERDVFVWQLGKPVSIEGPFILVQ
eukprot:GDKI01042594.1.p1 GENE.GDKI01042594.1~~GDKI01042594.1.p1  ORF type:complete len:341 (+),score=110.47 GDKI01042594.1:56-1024(+)